MPTIHGESVVIRLLETDKDAPSFVELGMPPAIEAAIREKFATPRVCQIALDNGDMSIEDLVDDKDLVITMTRAGYIKSVEARAFRTQGRGGRGGRRRAVERGAEDEAAGGRGRSRDRRRCV